MYWHCMFNLLFMQEHNLKSFWNTDLDSQFIFPFWNPSSKITPSSGNTFLFLSNTSQKREGTIMAQRKADFGVKDWVQIQLPYFLT